MHTRTLALVGATGGAGTTRTAVELAALGARDGRDVAVVDAAFTTQGLSEYVTGRIGTDLTTLITDETGASLSAATYPIVAGGGRAGNVGNAGDPGGRDGDAPDLPGRADALPARAPFERAARAKTAEAARKLERRIDEAATGYDAVIVDAAPVGSNEAVAGVTAADRTAAVYPATTHGRDALQRLRGRVADVGGGVDRSIAVARGVGADGTVGGDAEGDADVRLPPTDPAVASAPTAATRDGEYARAVAAAFEDAFDATVDIEFEEPGLVDRLTP
ncbi:ParA family protein [Halorubrum sp. CSM-61]|uniref:ParA family protein n=1 Tax=Halorubrum sp. CSM-61 TaxID=2485838 RepID=UPI000F4B9E31|nr:ParA family protein [Halorubrum sp. CSM-61]